MGRLKRRHSYTRVTLTQAQLRTSHLKVTVNRHGAPEYACTVKHQSLQNNAQSAWGALNKPLHPQPSEVPVIVYDIIMSTYLAAQLLQCVP